MRYPDIMIFVLGALSRYRVRTSLILLAMSIGIASIIVLTSLGEGARRYVIGEFASLGTNLVIVIPGRSETSGGSPAMLLGSTTRDLTIADAVAIKRHAAVKQVAPVFVGAASISHNQRDRDAPVLGSTSELLDIRHWKLARGKFLPTVDPERANSVCVLGTKIRNELFGNESALGQWVRLGDRRFRVIGILASEGRSIGVDVQDLVVIPAASARILFNTPSLFRILIEAKTLDAIPAVKKHTINTIKARHQGEEDVTVITQDAVLSTFDRILKALTVTVAGIAAISLGVAGILIMNIMLVAISQRTAEIGLLKALGAPARQIVVLFLAEAATLSFVGACLGVVLGEFGSWVIGKIYPTLPLGAPWWAVLAAFTTAIVTGLVFGALPARRAARLDPVLALAHK